MPRRARRESATGFYHIVSRGLDRENIFGEKREKTRFLNLLKDNLKDCNIEIYAYCVMSNHFHLLAKAEKEIMPIFMAKVLEDMRNIIIISIIVLVMYLKIDIIRSV